LAHFDTFSNLNPPRTPAPRPPYETVELVAG
jgi:hypothetical protein